MNIILNLNKIKYNTNFFLIFFICCVSFFLPFSIFISDLSLVLSSIIFLFVLYKKNDFKILYNKIFIFFLIWNIYLIINSLISSYPLLSLQSTLFYFRFTLFAFSVYYCMRKFSKFLNFFFISLTLSFLIIGFDAYVQLIFGYNLLGYEYNNGWNRLSGFFNEDYILGSYISRFLPIIIALFFNPKFEFKNKILISFILIFLSSILIIFSGERTALMNLLIFIFLFLFLLNISLKKTFIYFTLFCSFLIVFIFNSEIAKKRMFDLTVSQIIDGNNINLFSIQHQLIYQTSIKIFSDNKIVGIGPKNFREICNFYKSYSDLDLTENGCSTSPHNIYLQLLTETGIIGFIPILIIFIFLFFIIFFQIIKKDFFIYNKQKLLHHNLILIPFFISLWPIVPTGNFFNNWLSIVYYLPLGILIFYNYREQYE